MFRVCWSGWEVEPCMLGTGDGVKPGLIVTIVAQGRLAQTRQHKLHNRRDLWRLNAVTRQHTNMMLITMKERLSKHA